MTPATRLVLKVCAENLILNSLLLTMNTLDLAVLTGMRDPTVVEINYQLREQFLSSGSLHGRNK